MKRGSPPRDFTAPIPADEIAIAIVLASREVGADPLDVGAGKLDAVAGVPMKVRVIARARYYAGCVLRRLYPDRNQTTIACYVGANRNSAGAFFSGLDQRIANPAGLSWWRPGIVDRIVEDVRSVQAPRAAPTAPPKPPPCAIPAAPIAVRRQLEENVKMDGKVSPSRILQWNGVTLDLKERKVTHGAKEAVATDDGIRLVAALARVMPAFLPIDIIAKKVTGRVDAVELLRDVVFAANAALRGIDLEVRLVPKMGYMLADLTA